MPVDMSIPNSIMGAYFQGLAERRAREQQDTSNKLFQQQFEQQQAIFPEVINRMKAKVAADLASLKQHEAAMKATQAHLGLTLAEKMKQGVIKPNTTLPGTGTDASGQGIASVNVPGWKDSGGNVYDMSGAVTPQEDLARRMQEASAMIPLNAQSVGAEAAAKANATLPAQTKLEEVRSRNAMSLEDKRAANAAIRMQEQLNAQNYNKSLDRTSAQTLAHIHGKYMLEASKERADAAAPDPEVVSATVHQQLTGQMRSTPSKKVLDASKSLLTKLGGVEFTPKQYDELRAYNTTNTLFDALKKDIIEKLPDSGRVAFINSLTRHIAGTATKADYDRIQAQAPGIAHELGEVGRLSDPDVARSLGVLANPTMTKQAAQESLDMLITRKSNELNAKTFSGVPRWQRLAILQADAQGNEDSSLLARYNEKLPATVKDPKSGKPISAKVPAFRKNKASGKWEWYDPKANIYKGAEER